MIRRRHQGCACGTDLPGTCPGVENCPYSGYEPPMPDRAGKPIECIVVDEEPTECIFCGTRTEFDGRTTEDGDRFETCPTCHQDYLVTDVEDGE
jgi:hypothetical protein